MSGRNDDRARSAGREASNVSHHVNSIALPVTIVTQLLERPRRPLPEIAFSREEKDWSAYKTRIITCVENRIFKYALNT